MQGRRDSRVVRSGASRGLFAIAAAACVAVTPLLAVGAGVAYADPAPVTVPGEATTSPDGKTALGVTVDDDGNLYYEVVARGEKLVKKSQLGLDLSDVGVLGDNSEVTAVSDPTTTDENVGIVRRHRQGGAELLHGADVFRNR